MWPPELNANIPQSLDNQKMLPHVYRNSLERQNCRRLRPADNPIKTMVREGRLFAPGHTASEHQGWV